MPFLRFLLEIPLEIYEVAMLSIVFVEAPRVALDQLDHALIAYRKLFDDASGPFVVLTRLFHLSIQRRRHTSLLLDQKFHCAVKFFERHLVSPKGNAKGGT